MRDFGALLAERAEDGYCMVMGLDPVYERIPMSVPGRFDGDDVDPVEMAIAYYNFCSVAVNRVHDQLAGFRLNTAFFEAAGAAGSKALHMLIRHIHRVAPQTVVIVDAEQTIGKSDARFVFDDLGADAVTVDPDVDEEALRRVLDRPCKGVFVRCRTPNAGAAEFGSATVVDDGEIDGPLHSDVAHRVKTWKSNGTIGVVVDAAATEAMTDVRDILPKTWILASGVDAQGGPLEDAIRNGSTADGRGILISTDSSVPYTYDGRTHSQVTRRRVIEIDRRIRRVRASLAQRA